jgi:hypothetical protein
LWRRGSQPLKALAEREGLSADYPLVPNLPALSLTHATPLVLLPVHCSWVRQDASPRAGAGGFRGAVNARSTPATMVRAVMPASLGRSDAPGCRRSRSHSAHLLRPQGRDRRRCRRARTFRLLLPRPAGLRGTRLHGCPTRSRAPEVFGTHDTAAHRLAGAFDQNLTLGRARHGSRASTPRLLEANVPALHHEAHSHRPHQPAVMKASPQPLLRVPARGKSPALAAAPPVAGADRRVVADLLASLLICSFAHLLACSLLT